MPPRIDLDTVRLVLKWLKRHIRQQHVHTSRSKTNNGGGGGTGSGQKEASETGKSAAKRPMSSSGAATKKKGSRLDVASAPATVFYPHPLIVIILNWRCQSVHTCGLRSILNKTRGGGGCSSIRSTDHPADIRHVGPGTVYWRKEDGSWKDKNKSIA